MKGVDELCLLCGVLREQALGLELIDVAGRLAVIRRELVDLISLLSPYQIRYGLSETNLAELRDKINSLELELYELDEYISGQIRKQEFAVTSEGDVP